MHVILLSNKTLYNKITPNLQSINPLTRVEHVDSVDELMFLIKNDYYDAIILDINKNTTKDAIRTKDIIRIRKKNDIIPVICISKEELKNRISLLEAGVDYYIEKMSLGHILELSYAFGVMARRARGIYYKRVTLDNVTLDFEEAFLSKDGEDVKLRPQELKIIEYLAIRSGKVVSNKELEEAFNTTKNNIWVHVCSIRGKLRLPNGHPANVSPHFGRGFIFPKIKECIS